MSVELGKPYQAGHYKPHLDFHEAKSSRNIWVYVDMKGAEFHLDVRTPNGSKHISFHVTKARLRKFLESPPRGKK